MTICLSNSPTNIRATFVQSRKFQICRCGLTKLTVLLSLSAVAARVCTVYMCVCVLNPNNVLMALLHAQKRRKRERMKKKSKICRGNKFFFITHKLSHMTHLKLINIAQNLCLERTAMTNDCFISSINLNFSMLMCMCVAICFYLIISRKKGWRRKILNQNESIRKGICFFLFPFFFKWEAGKFTS